MKSDNYNDMLDGYFAGTASEEEIALLKTEGYIDEQNEWYAAALASERGKKMDWSFEEMLAAAEPAKVMPIESSTSWSKKLAAAAAVLAIISSTYFLWVNEKPIHVESELATITVEKTTDTPVIKIVDEVVLAQPELPQVKESIQKEKIKKRLSLQKTKVKAAVKEDDIHAADEWLVMVNGKPITNENEAALIANKSMAMLSANLSQTMEELKPITKIKIKL